MDKLPQHRLSQGAASQALAVAAIAVAAVLLSACATPGDLPHRLEPLLPAQLGLQQTAAPAVENEWWRAFRDPQLDDLIARALANHPSLQAAQARLAKAQALASGADAEGAPRIDGSYQSTRQRYSQHGLIPPPLAGTVRTDSNLQLNATWELDFFGRHRAALAAALGNARAAEAEAAGARVLLAGNVTRAYFQLARLVAQREVAERSLAQRQHMLSLIRQRVDAGLDTQVELRQGEGSIPETRQQIEALDEQIALTRHALAALTVQAPANLDGLAPRLESVQAVPLPTNVPADLLGRRADVDAARARVEAAGHDLDAAHALFYPSVNLVAFAGFSSLVPEKLLDATSGQSGIGPAIHLPLFDAGRLRANYRGKAADVDAAVAAYNGTVLDAVRDAADQIASLQSIERQRQAQAEAQAAAESAYDLATQRYQAGLAGYLTVLSAESGVLVQRRLGADLKARALDTQAALMRALGGGYSAHNTPSGGLASAH